MSIRDIPSRLVWVTLALITIFICIKISLNYVDTDWVDRVVIIGVSFGVFSAAPFFGSTHLVRNILALLCLISGFFLSEFTAAKIIPWFGLLVVNLGLGYVFARTLAPGKISLVWSFALKLTGGSTNTPGFGKFTYMQTTLWASGLFLIALISVIAMLNVDIREWAMSIVLSIEGFFVLFFFGCHLYARLIYKVNVGPIETIIGLSRTELWQVEKS